MISLRIASTQKFKDITRAGNECMDAKQTGVYVLDKTNTDELNVNLSKQAKVKINGISVDIPAALQVETGAKYVADQLCGTHMDSSLQEGSERRGSGKENPESKTYAEIATHLWKAQGRIVDSETGLPKEGYEKVSGDLVRIFRALECAGVTVDAPEDHVYDAGMRMTVLNFEPTPGIISDTIIEIIKPGVKINGYPVQYPAVIVGTPICEKEIETKGANDGTNND